MKAADIYEDVTADLVAMIECGDANGADWKAPWHTNGVDSIMSPRNAKTNVRYRGGNIVAFWATAFTKDYTHGLWATYRQWTEMGAQVRKGERAAYGIKWLVAKQTKAEIAAGKRPKMFPKGFAVFNVAQVDGYEIPEEPVRDISPIDHASEWIGKLGAKVTEGINSAYYSPGSDAISVPAIGQYDDAEDYYATLLHEHVHWTGHRSRLAREGITKPTKFGSDEYAREELIAELGAAFLCNLLGISNRPRIDHAQYLEHWLRVLRTDAKALFTAASKAQAAVDWCEKVAGVIVEEETAEENDGATVGVAA